MRRSLALALLLTLLTGGELASQVLEEALVPRGRLRLQAYPSFTSWDSRFGRTDSGVTGREALGEDLTSPSATSYFPGIASLSAALEAMSGTSGYTPVLGETLGRVTQDITRIDFGAHIGIFDWLTIGAVLPWIQTRSTVEMAFRPDTLGGDLGLNPTDTDAASVDAFLQALGSAELAAQADAGQICGAAPGGAACVSAQALADRTSAFLNSVQTAYAASPFFPIAGSAIATSATQTASTLDADLVAAGLAGISIPIAFATQWAAAEDFAFLVTGASAGVQGTPLQDVKGLWGAGDVEVSATVRLLEGEARDSAAASPRYSYRLIGTVLGRLPTGTVDDPDIFFDLGTGDGQTDLEGRILATITVGERLGIQGGARYGIQMSRTLVRRVAAPEVVLAPFSTRQLVKWSPGAYFGLELAPAWRLSDVLTLTAEYRIFRKSRDSYELAGTPTGNAPDPLLLERESGVTLHQVGGGLRYDTVARWLAGGASTPFRLHLRFLRAVAGGGGQTPVTTRVEFGARLFRRLWGPS